MDDSSAGRENIQNTIHLHQVLTTRSGGWWGVGTWWSLGSLPTRAILWFYSMILWTVGMWHWGTWTMGMGGLSWCWDWFSWRSFPTLAIPWSEHSNVQNAASATLKSFSRFINSFVLWNWFGLKALRTGWRRQLWGIHYSAFARTQGNGCTYTGVLFFFRVQNHVIIASVWVGSYLWRPSGLTPLQWTGTVQQLHSAEGGVVRNKM